VSAPAAALPRLWSFRASPFAGKARAAFAEKGVDVELVEIHPARRPPRLRELNPLNRVPVLELPGGAALRESSVILEWLEERHPQPALWPDEPELRAQARAWGRWLDDALLVNFFLGMRKLAYGLDEHDPPDEVERLHGRVPRQWKVLEGALGAHEGPWLMGAQFTYADLTGLPLAVRVPEWMPALAPDEHAHPRAAAWLARLRERPSAAAIDQAGEPIGADA
jgi:glutathione S-transferase